MALYYGLWGATGLPLEIEKSNLYKYKQNTKLKTIYGTGGINKGWWKLSKEKKKKDAHQERMCYLFFRDLLYFSLLGSWCLSVQCDWIQRQSMTDHRFLIEHIIASFAMGCSWYLPLIWATFAQKEPHCFCLWHIAPVC